MSETKNGAAFRKVLRFQENGVVVEFDSYCKKLDNTPMYHGQAQKRCTGGWWTVMCADCREKYIGILRSRIDVDAKAVGIGVCGVKGCWNKAVDCVDFEVDEVSEAADNNPESYDAVVCDGDDLASVLNMALWIKARREQEVYRAKLLEKQPAEILEYAFEYAMREDIVCWLENNDLDEEDAATLLSQDDVVAGILDCFENRESDHMEEIGVAIEDHAFEVRENGECKQLDARKRVCAALEVANKLCAEQGDAE